MNAISGQIGSEVLFENDRIRVWEMKLAPGEGSGVHQHRNDYLFLYVTPNNELETRFTDGRVSRKTYEDGFVQNVVVGKNPASHMTHELHNAGSRPHRQILVEFLEESSAAETLEPENNGRWEQGIGDKVAS